MNYQLIECVPNFSEGRDKKVIRSIARAIRSVKGVALLHVDANESANRTVMTFVGSPNRVVEAAYLAIAEASKWIDMRVQKGEHPRIGATDVCPLVPLANISMEEVAELARGLGERVGSKLGIPVYLYEAAASRMERKNLAAIRKGQYEGLGVKMGLVDWAPDFGPRVLNERSGATVIGARDFLIAINVSLETDDVKVAKAIAGEIREGRRGRDEGLRTMDEGRGTMDEGRGTRGLKGVKAIGWFMEIYGRAQVSMNITDISSTPVHVAFEACKALASEYGVGVIGSELIGMVPERVFLEAGGYYRWDVGCGMSDVGCGMWDRAGDSKGGDRRRLIQDGVVGLGLPFLKVSEYSKRILEVGIGKAFGNL